MKPLFIYLQYLLPQHLVSRAVGALAASEIGPIKNTFISIFKKKFGISLAQAERKKIEDYRSFNDFFTRALEAGARPIDANKNSICSPADGCFSQLGPIKSGRIFQAKGQDYSATELLADKEAAKLFENGEFATIYLSPKDYHRVHMPVAGKLVRMTYIPGDLYSVNQCTAAHVPRLFSRNERLVCHFESEQGPMAMVLVGAMIVAAIETTWAGTVAPAGQHITSINYEDGPSFNKGDEMGRFKLGSTVILLWPENTMSWNTALSAQSPCLMGEAIGQVN